MPSLPLFAFPGKPASSEKSPLVGIARLAASGESLREGHNVEYFTLPAKSLLNRCVSNRSLPFTWTINPYRRCEFGCQYCYARYTHEFMEMRDGADFEQKIYVKQHTADLLRRELKKVKPAEPIALGTATDPYQPAERRYEVTLGILQECARQQLCWPVPRTILQQITLGHNYGFALLRKRGQVSTSIFNPWTTALSCFMRSRLCIFRLNTAAASNRLALAPGCVSPSIPFFVSLEVGTIDTL